MSSPAPKYHSYKLNKDTNKISVDTDLNFLYNPDKHPPISGEEIVTSMFNLTSLIALVGFLAIYFVLYFLLGKVYGSFTPLPKVKGVAVSFTILLVLLGGIAYFYYSLPKNDQDNFIRYVMLLFQDEMNDPNTIFIVLEFLIVFYVLVFALGLPMSEGEKPFALHIVELKSWLYIALLIIILFFFYVLNIEIVDLVYFECYRLLDVVNKYEAEDTTGVGAPAPAPAPAPKPAFTTPPSIPAPAPSPSTKGGETICKTKKTSTTPQPSCPAPPSDLKEGSKEVFNVGNNLYTYDDAQAICKAYGARLANYDDIEEAYDAGAEWCNYGWSEGQMVYFPTQKTTWDILQKDPKTMHKCGRPGINGGFINNPNIKFGVNCYGVKPPPNDMEKAMMEANKAQPPGCPAPPPPDPNVEKWKQQLDKVHVNSYNSADWSQFS